MKSVYFITLLGHFLVKRHTNSLPTNDDSHFSMMKELDGILYLGGRNSLQSFEFLDDKRIQPITKQTYNWPKDIINGSSSNFNYEFSTWPDEISKNSSLIFDACLNWKQDHPNSSFRQYGLDYHHYKYHTPSGDWDLMDIECTNSFIKSVETLNNETLWVCATFGSFPRAFSVNKTTLEFIQFVDVNVMSCARYVDEPMATFRDKSTNDLYVASGWGLYRPDKRNPDVPDNNSTMLYADWRLYRNLFTLPSAMAWVLSSDVNFINVVKETNDHLYFFGHEINNQYGLNNQEDRNAWQSFMLRICKRDLGYKYLPTDVKVSLDERTSVFYYSGRVGSQDYWLSLQHSGSSYSKEWYIDTVHLPTTHFVNPIKINFGCYIGKRPRAISDNHLWGETNVVYINKLADVLFDPKRKIKFKTQNNNKYFGCNNEDHSQLPLIGIFNSAGIKGTSISPSGALCHLQINENIFNEIGSRKSSYNIHRVTQSKSAYEEIMTLNSMSYSNFYSRTLHRTNGFTLHPYWNQGVLIGDSSNNQDYQEGFENVGKCYNSSFYKQLNKDTFLRIQNFSNTAWPNELSNRLSSIPSAICQYSAAELYSFNASFVIPGVEFKKIFLIKENITNYIMHKFPGELDSELNKRKETSPLILVVIISNSGTLYRVVLCDFDNGMLNHGKNKTSNEWYNWCIFRRTDQPYLYRQYAPMERREWGESYQYRASSLLMEKDIVERKLKFSHLKKDGQRNIIKEIIKKGNYLHVLTGTDVYTVDIQMNCRSYSRCVDCASDPSCMWSASDSCCTSFNEDRYRNKSFVQDVLDRGFRCASLITSNGYLKHLKSDKVIIFICSNADFWRGPVVWRINEREINKDVHQQIFLSGNRTILTMFDDLVIKVGTTVSCHGINGDNDKLFRGLEYEGVILTSEITLNRFIIIEKDAFCLSWLLCFSVVGILIILLLTPFLLFLCLRKYIVNRNNKSNSVNTNETKSTVNQIVLNNRKLIK